MDNAFILVVDAIFMAFETFLLVYFIDNSLYRREWKWARGRMFVVRQALTLTFIQMAHRMILYRVGNPSLIFTVAADALTFLSYKGSIHKKVFLLSLYYSFSIVMDVSFELITTVVHEYIPVTNILIAEMPVIPMAASKLCLAAAVVITGSSLKMEHNLKDWVKFIPVPLTLIFLLIIESPFTRDLKEEPEAIFLFVVICVFGVLINIFLIVVFHRNNTRNQLEYRLEISEENRRNSKAHYIELRHAYRKSERSAHDFMHHLNHIEGVSNINQVHKYIAKLKKRSFSQILNYTGNFDIDVILNAKQHEANKKSIHIKLKPTSLPVSIPWVDPIDISIILGNLLSNAVEACERIGGKEIQLSFKYNEDVFAISVSNPSAKPPPRKQKGVGFLSSKNDGGIHGLGMENIAASAELYDGLMKYEWSDGVFKTEILLQRGGR